MDNESGLEQLIENTATATTAVQGATRALEKERFTRKVQLVAEAVVIALMLAFVLFHVQESEDRDDRIKDATCEAINSGRHDVREILTRTITAGAANRTPEEQERAEKFVEQVNTEVLQPLDCDAY